MILLTGIISFAALYGSIDSAKSPIVTSPIFAKPQAPEIASSTQGQALLDRAVFEGTRLRSLSTIVEVRWSSEPSLDENTSQNTSQTYYLLFSRPNRGLVALQKPAAINKTIVALADGTKFYSHAQSLPQQTPLGATVYKDLVEAAHAFAEPAGGVLPALMTDTQPLGLARTFYEGRSIASLLQAKPVNIRVRTQRDQIEGIQCQVIDLDTDKQPSGNQEHVTVWMGSDDFLIRKISYTLRVERDANPRSITRTEIYKEVRTNVIIPDSAFDYQNAEGTKQILTNNQGGAVKLEASKNLIHRAGDALLQNEIVDVGKVSLLNQPEIIHKFSIVNSTPFPLQIVKISTSCGCISTFLAPSKTQNKTETPETLPTILPGQSRDLNMRVSLSSVTPGALYKRVGVFVQGQTEPIAYFIITGTLLPTVTFVPNTIFFEKTPFGKSEKRNISVLYDTQITKNGELPELVSASPYLRVLRINTPNKNSLETGWRTQQYQVSLLPTAPIGPLSSLLSFKLAVQNPSTTRKLVPAKTKAEDLLSSVSAFVYGEIIGDVKTQPALIAFGLMEKIPTPVIATQKHLPERYAKNSDSHINPVVLASRDIELVEIKKGVLKNARVLITHPYLSARISVRHDSQQPESNKYILTVQVMNNISVKTLNTGVTILLANGQQVFVPVTGFIQDKADSSILTKP